jgi:hypothetical protein
MGIERLRRSQICLAPAGFTALHRNSGLISENTGDSVRWRLGRTQFGHKQWTAIPAWSEVPDIGTMWTTRRRRKDARVVGTA